MDSKLTFYELRIIISQANRAVIQLNKNWLIVW